MRINMPSTTRRPQEQANDIKPQKANKTHYLKLKLNFKNLANLFMSAGRKTKSPKKDDNKHVSSNNVSTTAAPGKTRARSLGSIGSGSAVSTKIDTPHTTPQSSPAGAPSSLQDQSPAAGPFSPILGPLRSPSSSSLENSPFAGPFPPVVKAAGNKRMPILDLASIPAQATAGSSNAALVIQPHPLAKNANLNLAEGFEKKFLKIPQNVLPQSVLKNVGEVPEFATTAHLGKSIKKKSPALLKTEEKPLLTNLPINKPQPQINVHNDNVVYAIRNLFAEQNPSKSVAMIEPAEILESTHKLFGDDVADEPAVEKLANDKLFFAYSTKGVAFEFKLGDVNTAENREVFYEKNQNFFPKASGLQALTTALKQEPQSTQKEEPAKNNSEVTNHNDRDPRLVSFVFASRFSDLHWNNSIKNSAAAEEVAKRYKEYAFKNN
jgi:hypothetical protein